MTIVLLLTFFLNDPVDGYRSGWVGLGWVCVSLGDVRYKAASLQKCDHCDAKVVPGRVSLLVTLFLSLTALLVSTISSSPEVHPSIAHSCLLLVALSVLNGRAVSQC